MVKKKEEVENSDTANSSGDYSATYITEKPKNRFDFLRSKTAKVFGLAAAGALVLTGTFAAGAVAGRLGFGDEKSGVGPLSPFGHQGDYADKDRGFGRDFRERGHQPPHLHDQFGSDVMPAPEEPFEAEDSEQP